MTADGHRADQVKRWDLDANTAVKFSWDTAGCFRTISLMLCSLESRQLLQILFVILKLYTTTRDRQRFDKDVHLLTNFLPLECKINFL